jgi:hypothetical protein
LAGGRAAAAAAAAARAGTVDGVEDEVLRMLRVLCNKIIVRGWAG